MHVRTMWGYCSECKRWSFEKDAVTKHCPKCDDKIFQEELDKFWVNKRVEKELGIEKGGSDERNGSEAA